MQRDAQLGRQPGRIEFVRPSRASHRCSLYVLYWYNKVQILTQKALQAPYHPSLCPLSRQYFRQGTQFIRVTSTSVQILTQRRCAAREALPALASQDACGDEMLCGDEMMCDDAMRVDDDQMRVGQEGYEPEALAGLLAPATVGRRPLLRRALRDL